MNCTGMARRSDGGLSGAYPLARQPDGPLRRYGASRARRAPGYPRSPWSRKRSLSTPPQVGIRTPIRAHRTLRGPTRLRPPGGAAAIPAPQPGALQRRSRGRSFIQRVHLYRWCSASRGRNFRRRFARLSRLQCASRSHSRCAERSSGRQTPHSPTALTAFFFSVETTATITWNVAPGTLGAPPHGVRLTLA
jgi:hypothetical protein